MEIKGLLTTANFEKSWKGDKDVFRARLSPDDGNKEMTFYANGDLQAITISLVKKHVSIDYHMDGKYKVINAIIESEAPANAPKQAEKAPETYDVRQTSIEQQVAIKAISLLLAAGKIEKTHPCAIKTIAWCDARLPEPK